MKTIEEIEQYLRSHGVSGVQAVRFRKLAKEFATVEAFFSAKKGDIEKAYNKLTPGKVHGVGRGFWDAFNKALDYYKGFVKNDVAEFAVKQAQAIEEEGRNTEKILSRMFTYAELKAIVDMMEYCGIESLNFIEVSGLLDNVKLRQKKTEPAEKDKSYGSGECDVGKI